ncbi:hypothetical protein ABBQ38_013376 [Trebouxia sp. C0009 RCD-2024]
MSLANNAGQHRLLVTSTKGNSSWLGCVSFNEDPKWPLVRNEHPARTYRSVCSQAIRSPSWQEPGITSSQLHSAPPNIFEQATQEEYTCCDGAAEMTLSQSVAPAALALQNCC